MGIKTIEKIKEALGALEEMRAIYPKVGSEVQHSRMLDLEQAVRDLIKDFSMHPRVMNFQEGDSVTIRNSEVPVGRYWIAFLKEDNPKVISIEVAK